MYSTIISADDLTQNMDSPRWVVLDCRFDVQLAQWGRQQFQIGHIPSAHYADLDQDLCGKPTADSGRHPLPELENIQDFFASCGISSDSQVVVYDQSSGMIATRAWWTLQWLGHSSAAVLDGGFEKWVQEGRPTSDAIPSHGEAGNFRGHPNREMHITVSQLQELMRKKNSLLVDSRSPARFRGEGEVVDRVAGHIPGAINFFLTNNLDKDGYFLPTEQLKDNFAPLVKEHTVNYCGSGVTACHNVLSMKIAGFPSKLYVGSWSEWIQNPARAIATEE